MDDNNDLKNNLADSAREILSGAGIKMPKREPKDNTIYDEYGNPIEQDVKKEEVVDYSKLKSVQTQSLVKTSREEANEELAKISSYNDEIDRQNAAAARQVKAKRTATYIAIGLVFFIVLCAGVWMLIQILNISSPEEVDPVKPVVEKEEVFSTVDGYQCKTSTCSKVADFPEGDDRILLRDTKYYIYNADTQELILTSIDEQEYRSIEIFNWGDEILALLNPESEKTAIFSVTSNCLISDYIFDKVYTSINDIVYKNMTYVYGSYIVGYGSSYYRIVSMASHGEVVKSAGAVYVYDEYVFDYENNGYISVYNLSGTKLTRVNTSDSFIAVKDSKLLTIKVTASSASISGLDSDGNKLNSTKDEIIKGFNNKKAGERADYVKNDNSFYKIPTSIDYSAQN